MELSSVLMVFLLMVTRHHRRQFSSKIFFSRSKYPLDLKAARYPTIETMRKNLEGRHMTFSIFEQLAGVLCIAASFGIMATYIVYVVPLVISMAA